jgi:hypothetical protein
MLILIKMSWWYKQRHWVKNINLWKMSLLFTLMMPLLVIPELISNSVTESLVLILAKDKVK